MLTLTDEESLMYIRQAKLKAARDDKLSEAERIILALTYNGKELTTEQVGNIVQIMEIEYSKFRERNT